MFNKDSLLYSVNSVVKLLGTVIFICSIIWLKQSWLLLVISILLTLIVDKNKYIKKIAYISIFIGIMQFFYQPFMWINKFLIIVLYFIVILAIYSTEQIKYLCELIFYPFQNKYITNFYVSGLYAFKSLKNNCNRLRKIIDSYGLSKNISLLKNISSAFFHHTKEDIEDMNFLHHIRFYNWNRSRTYIEQEKIESWDICYILIHLIFLIITVTLGR
ncbi:MAG: hypothetical protein RSB99_00570 [Bacilli bacterium]